MPLIAAGHGVRRGVTSAQSYDHYSLLATIEDNWGLGRLANAACSCTKAMTDLLAPP